jgi:hypothetical protein
MMAKCHGALPPLKTKLLSLIYAYVNNLAQRILHMALSLLFCLSILDEDKHQKIPSDISCGSQSSLFRARRICFC